MPYRGHRANSFYAIDDAELVEIRARQRTFDGAAFRTAMGNLSYAIVVLKLFDQRFYRSKLQHGLPLYIYYKDAILTARQLVFFTQS